MTRGHNFQRDTIAYEDDNTSKKKAPRSKNVSLKDSFQQLPWGIKFAQRKEKGVKIRGLKINGGENKLTLIVIRCFKIGI